MTAERRIVFVHAHPDDESIGTGATMAHYAATGAEVTLVTCTLGEEGECHVPALDLLQVAHADQLGGWRIAELRDACAALGVTDHRFLGGAGRYRDSGMMDTPANAHPRSFWGTPVDEAAAHLVEVLLEVRPQVLVTYDPIGFYGHPDHIQAHRVAMRAVELAAVAERDPWQVSKVYWTAVPRSVLEAGMDQFANSAENPFAGVTNVDDLPFGSPDDEIDACIDATDHADAKLAALRAHATQIPPDSWLFALAGNVGAEALGVEHYRLAVGSRGTANGWEDDLFAEVTR